MEPQAVLRTSYAGLHACSTDVKEQLSQAWLGVLVGMHVSLIVTACHIMQISVMFCSLQLQDSHMYALWRSYPWSSQAMIGLTAQIQTSRAAVLYTV